MLRPRLLASNAFLHTTCVLYVKNVLRIFFSDFLKSFQNIERKKMVVGKSSWQCCQNCIPRVQRIILKKLFKKVVFPISFRHWEKKFGRFTKNFPAWGSKLHSTFQKEHFEDFFLINKSFFPLIGHSVKHLSCFGKNFTPRPQKLQFTCPREQFEKYIYFSRWKRVHFQLILDNQSNQFRLVVNFVFGNSKVIAACRKKKRFWVSLLSWNFFVTIRHWVGQLFCSLLTKIFRLVCQNRNIRVLRDVCIIFWVSL